MLEAEPIVVSALSDNVTVISVSSNKNLVQWNITSASDVFIPQMKDPFSPGYSDRLPET